MIAFQVLSGHHLDLGQYWGMYFSDQFLDHPEQYPFHLPTDSGSVSLSLIHYQISGKQPRYSYS